MILRDDWTRRSPVQLSALPTPAETHQQFENRMGFVELQHVPVFEPVPGCRLRTPYGQNLMLSYLEMEPGAEVPLHHHVHEQAGVVLSGRLQLTIGEETRILEPGSMFIVPPNTPHRAVAVDGPVRVMDVFAPIRDDYRQMSEQAMAAEN